MPLTLYGENILSAYPCVSFRRIEKTGAKRPVSIHGTANNAAGRTISAARLSDILRGSYRRRAAISRIIAAVWQSVRNGRLCTKQKLLYLIKKGMSREN